MDWVWGGWVGRFLLGWASGFMKHTGDFKFINWIR